MIVRTEWEELYQYAVEIYRELHAWPEVGFALERTVAKVSGELREMGIPYSTEYGTCSLVAELGQGERLLALRADMDALPVEEKTELPFKSRIPGQMHACGHDSHTAILLAVARFLKRHEEELSCRVRLIFQPSEEGAISGAKMMVEHNVMEGVDEVIATHCDAEIETGRIGVHSGDYMAACIPMTISFLGKTAHAAKPEYGVDAVAMCVEAYQKLKEMVTGEAGERRYIWCVGRFSGGTVHNVIADRCEMDISFRYYDKAFAQRVMQQAEAICAQVAASYGGKAVVDWHVSAEAVHNQAELTEAFCQSLEQAGGFVVEEMPSRMTSEDFCWYLTKAPGMIFRFGIRNEEKGCTAIAHRNDFCVDEEGMRSAIGAFISYVMQRK